MGCIVNNSQSGKKRSFYIFVMSVIRIISHCFILLLCNLIFSIFCLCRERERESTTVLFVSVASSVNMFFHARPIVYDQISRTL